MRFSELTASQSFLRVWVKSGEDFGMLQKRLFLELCSLLTAQSAEWEEESGTIGFLNPAFLIIERLAVRVGVTPIRRRTWSIEIGEWFILVNGHNHDVVCGHTVVPSYFVYASYRRQSVAIFTPFVNRMLVGYSEAKFIACLSEAVTAAGLIGRNEINELLGNCGFKQKNREMVFCD